jgi:Rieske Fe-S protein
VFKDEKGLVHAVSGKCTHLGCVLSWNNAELSWDCPCHGSRFAANGEILNGPAVKRLEQIRAGEEAA